MRTKCPAIIAKGGNSMIALLDSTIDGDGVDIPAIQTEGALYLRNVNVSGYAAAVKTTKVKLVRKGKKRTTQKTPGLTLPAGKIDEFIAEHKLVLHADSQSGSLALPVEEVPILPREPHEKWVNILKYAHLKKGDKKEEDWAAAIQKAVDDGAECIYFPASSKDYPIAADVHLRGNLKRLFGMRNKIGGKGRLVFEHSGANHTLTIERLELGAVHHDSPGTLVMLSSWPKTFTNSRRAGRLFLFNSLGSDWHFQAPLKVWARQWNVERHGPGPCIISRGAQIWSLGFKTEYDSQKIQAVCGSRIEILGAFLYPIGKIPPDRPLIVNEDSDLAIMYGLSVYRSNHRIQILDRKNGRQTIVSPQDLLWVGSRARMDLFVSRGLSPSRQ
ncbi:MAG: hypothetical protein D6820_08155 [Lentisphaerae bacterium]|nr:MAG: hypothetical protein D6820_08155 [Lentisphaerota bacterium]